MKNYQNSGLNYDFLKKWRLVIDIKSRFNRFCSYAYSERILKINPNEYGEAESELHKSSCGKFIFLSMGSKVWERKVRGGETIKEILNL